jgi:hypothetical protein
MHGADMLHDDYESNSVRTAIKIVNFVSVVVGLAAMGCGCFGIYFGTKTVQAWPPYTWNNILGGIFTL